jgi:plasmid stability protein
MRMGCLKEEGMATLQVRDIDDGLYSSLKLLAGKEHRSISQEVVKILESHVQHPDRKMPDSTKEFLSLGGAWEDGRSTEAIVKEIRRVRKNSGRLRGKNVVFD